MKILTPGFRAEDTVNAIQTKPASWKTFSIRGLLVATTFVAITLAIRSYLDPLNQYRRTGSQVALVDAIQGRMVDGMDRDEVIALLGRPVDATRHSRIKKLRDGYIAMVRKVAPLNALGFPDGFQETDEFLSFSCVQDSGDENIATLHFRDGKLINFSTQWLHDDGDVFVEVR